MENNNQEIDELIKQFSKLPGLGPKSAKRIILKLITNKENSVNAFKNIKELENAFLKSKTKISLAMTNSIPAGIYAKEFLENIGVWKNIKRNY